MKLYLVLILCGAVAVFAAPVKENEGAESDGVKAKAKISVEVKPTDLQVKLSPVRIQAKVGERKSIVATTITLTTEPTTVEPTEADETNSTPQPTKEPVKPAKVVKQTTAPKKVKTEKRMCA